MIIKQYTAGPIDANNYLVADEKTKEAVLIDCSEKVQQIIDDVKNLGLNVKYILLTHGHFDHVMGVNDMKKELDELFAFGKEIIDLLEQEIRQRDNKINTLENDYKDTKDRFEQMKQSLRNLLRD